MPTGKQKRIKKRLDRRQSKVDESRATFGSNDPHLGKFDRRLSRLQRTVKQAEKQGMDVDYDTRNASGEGTVKTTKYKSATQIGHSPAEMSPYKMESAKQEKYNLMHDNPVAKHASGSWMSKHSKSAFHMGNSPMHKIDPPVNSEKNTKEIPSSLGNLSGYIKDTDSAELADMKRKQKALTELRRQRGHYGPDTPSTMDNLSGYIKDTDSKELADMKRKQAAIREIRRQKGHFNKK